jgi:hypothetical protein
MNRRFRAWSLGAAVAASVFAALLQAGCGSGESSLQPQATTCSVTGNVTRFGAGDNRLRVRFRRVGTATGEFVGPVDEAGGYRLELPAGDYVAAAEVGYSSYWRGPDGAIVSHSGEADTLRLSAATPSTRVDFRFGSLHLAGEVPAGLAAYRMNVTYYRRTEWAPDGSDIRYDEADVSDGLVDFDSGPLPPGDYRVRLVWEGPGSRYGEQYWLPGTALIDSAAWYRAGADSLGEVPVSFPGPVARLEGRITGAWQAMQVTVPRLMAYDLDGNPVAGPYRPLPDGSFSFEFHRPVPVRIEAADRSISYWVGGPREENATVFPLVPGETISGADAVIPGAVIRVVAGSPGLDHHSVTLEFMDPVDQSLVMRIYSSYDEQVVLTCMLPGQYLLHAKSGSFGSSPARPQWYDRAATPESATLVSVPDGGGVVHLDVRMERGGTISGMATVATDSSGWGMIVVTGADNDIVLGRTYGYGTATKEFLLQGLEDGSYKLGYLPASVSSPRTGEPAPAGIVWYPHATEWAAATPIVIGNGGDVTGIVIDVP